MKKYQELEQKIKELQAEVDRLKAQEKEDKLPDGFYREWVLNFLNEPHDYSIEFAFDWDDTPQGREYWNDIEKNSGMNDDYKIPDEAVIQLQKWVSLSHQEQKVIKTVTNNGPSNSFR